MIRIVAATTRLATWRLDGTGSARGRGLRTAILLELRDDAGASGLGEAAPLPGMSIEGLDDAARDLAAFAARLPVEIDGVAAVAEVSAGVDSPAARCAIETALLDVLGRGRGVAVSALLAAYFETVRAETLPLAMVVDTPDEARAAIARRARCLKIKIGEHEHDTPARPPRPPRRPDRREHEHEHEHVAAIAAIAAIAAAHGAVVRLDANRAWPPACVADELDALARTGLPIDFVEEPCADPLALAGSALPLASDESLATLTAGQLERVLPAIEAVVLKPTLLGLLGAGALAIRARAAGKRAIVTHALEGPIGTAAAAELALALSGHDAVGLGAHPALAAWYTPVAQIARATTELVRAPAPGIGIGEDLAAVVATLDDPLAPRPRVTRSTVDVVVAHPVPATVEAILEALAAARPIALLHHALPADELARRRAMIERAELPADTAVVLFTSGSTGAARGVALSRAALIAAADASAARLGWYDDDAWLVALSLAHAGGLAALVRCVVARRPYVLLAPGAALSTALDRVTLASLVPAQLAMLLDDPAWRSPSRLRAVLLGGAAASPALLAAAAARGVPFLPTYGMTESFGQLATAPLAYAGDPDAPLVPLPGVTLHAGTRAHPTAISVRAPMLATRYLDGASIRPAFVTADVGYVEDGVLHVVGRGDDVIVTGGENVHPAAVEAVLAATPGVRAACAFGIADARWGEIVGAAIAVDAGFDRGALATWHAALPAHARPRELAIARELPMLPTGKLDRRAAARIPREPIDYGVATGRS